MNGRKPQWNRIAVVLTARSRGPAWQWAILLLFALALGWLFTVFGIVGAMFQAPMIAGLVFALAGSPLRVHRGITTWSQGLIGCLVAHALDPAILAVIAGHGLAIALVLVSTALASLVLAWALIRLRVFDGETAAWAVMPGAAGVMVALAADRGADSRIVATMQYMRVIVVVASASLIGSLLTDAVRPVPAAVRSAGAGLAAIDPLASLWVIAVICVAVPLGRLLRIPAGPLLLSTVLAALLRFEAGVDVVVPAWILVAAYGGLGLFVGLQFDTPAVRRIARALPMMIGCILFLTLCCALSGLAFARILGVSAVTGFLATSPGSIDSIAILGLDAGADMSVVMTMQVIRFFALLIAAPGLVWLAKLADRPFPAE